MKTTIFTAILFTASCICKAQIYFGANAGINISSLKTKVNGKDDGFKSDIGYIISTDVNIPVSTSLLLQTGLQYESYHTKLNVTNTGTNFTEVITGKTHLEYLNIPVKLLCQVHAGNNIFSIGGGPYIGIGLSGHTKGTAISERDYGSGFIVKDTNATDQALKFGAAANEINRINIGLGLQAIYLLQNNICFSLYTNIGLANLNNQQKTTTKAVTAGITVGYVFRRKTKKSK